MFTGIRQFELADDQTGDRLPMVVMYPTVSAPSQERPTPDRTVTERSLPYTEQLAPGAPVAPGRHLLAVISHGCGGSHLAYTTLASHLARNGCVVALPEHPGDRNDNRLEGVIEKLKPRPRSVSLAIDAIGADPKLGPHVWRDNVAVMGHAAGGYTALAAAGDSRVRAVVLMAPGVPWYFGDSTLSNVNVPILMFTASSELCAMPWHAEVLARALQDSSLLSCRQVPNVERDSVQRDLGDQIHSFLRSELIRVRSVGLQRS